LAVLSVRKKILGIIPPEGPQTEMRSRKETKGPGEVGDRGGQERKGEERRRRKQQNTKDRIETRFKDSSTSESGKQKKTDRQTDRRRREKNLHTEGQKKREETGSHLSATDPRVEMDFFTISPPPGKNLNTGVTEALLGNWNFSSFWLLAWI